MSRQLLILRHAKSSWDSGAVDDFDRPLAERGERDAPRMGKWLKDQGIKPDYIVSSPAQRARQTALAACKKAGVKKKRIHWDDRIYGGGTRELLEVLAEVPARAETVMLVGHNPGLEHLLIHLWGEQAVIPPDGKLLPTAALARVELPRKWKQLPAGAAKSVAVTRVKEL